MFAVWAVREWGSLGECSTASAIRLMMLRDYMSWSRECYLVIWLFLKVAKMRRANLRVACLSLSESLSSP